MPRVNPDILRWARSTAGLDLPTAAKKIGLNAARGVAGEDRLRALEAGDGVPTRALLSKMAGTYRRPLLAFYMPQAPQPAERVEDFRTLPERRPEAEPLVQTLVRDVRARQGLVREFLEDEEAPALPFVASTAMGQGAEALALSMQAALRFDLERFRGAGSPDAAFSYLRGQVERLGVFVLLIGDLGSHHTEIDTEAFRGFALADPLAPFIVINDRDAHTAWAFTLLHEFAHLFLGVSGVSGARSITAVERFCNDAASRILLPPQEAAGLAIDRHAGVEALARRVTELAGPRRLSRTLIAFRLFEAGALGEQQWETLRARFAQEWRDARRDQRDVRKAAGKKGGPDYYIVRRQRLGALVGLVGRAVDGGALTPTKAGKVLGVGPRSVEPLIRSVAA